MFEGDFKLVHHLAPPLMARKNEKGELVKRPFGPWMRTAFRVMAKLKGLRGTPFDAFGYTEERKVERALIGEYCKSIEELLQTLSQRNLDLALEIARLPEDVRGYGHVKARNLAAVRARWERLMTEWRSALGAQSEAGPKRKAKA